jgi:chloramphenicol-sensitive protein RarD
LRFNLIASRSSEPVAGRLGLPAAISAYLIWGLFPLFYFQLNRLPALEVLCHRVLWSLVFCLALLLLSGKLAELVRALTTRKTLIGLLASGSCITLNWGAYIWSVTKGQALDASLAYYSLPLVTLGLGVVVLRERLTLRQTIAVLIVVAAVLILTADRGKLPWILVVLPLSFGLYGFLRKTVAVDALVGVTVETLLMAPLALGYLALQPGGGALFTGPPLIRTLLMLCGPVTTIPLVLFAFGARRLPLATLGLLQYLNPTMQMVIAATLLGEHLSRMQVLTFALIWLGLAIYSLPLGRRSATG